MVCHVRKMQVWSGARVCLPGGQFQGVLQQYPNEPEGHQAVVDIEAVFPSHVRWKTPGQRWLHFTPPDIGNAIGSFQVFPGR